VASPPLRAPLDAVTNGQPLCLYLTSLTKIRSGVPRRAC
jgi:hypothetical protein